LAENRSAEVQELQNGAAALSHSHVIADLTGPCAMISRYRLEAYTTLGELKNSRTQEFKNRDRPVALGLLASRIPALAALDRHRLILK